MNEWTLIILVMLAETCLHYFPWRMLLRGRELPRLGAYTLGLLAIMVPLSAWLYQNGEYDALGTLWKVTCAAGVTVFALYGLDHYLDLIMKDIEATEREKRNAQEG